MLSENLLQAVLNAITEWTTDGTKYYQTNTEQWKVETKGRLKKFDDNQGQVKIFLYKSSII